MTFTQIAQLVNEREYVLRPITRQGVRHIAATDPSWPVPREEWMKLGTAWVMPWPPIEKFFRERTSRGRGAIKKPSEAPAAKEDGPESAEE